MKRRQAAVVFNDIQGYTSLMQDDEALAIRLRQRHKEVVDRLTETYHGKIIQYYGDGTLSIFDTALEAVQCALTMQQEFGQAPQVPLRIGINAGDVLFGPDGIYGDSVNIASRIERMSIPGSILISDQVNNELKIHGGIQTRDLGRFELKNVRDPMHIHAIVCEGIKVPDPEDLAGKIGFKEKTIMVLPFYNLSQDPESDFFSDGITEQIIYALAEIEGLRVISRTSSFTFKDKHVNLGQLHLELGIDHILEGSVRQHGNKVRITAQLINAADDFHLWSETFNREIADAFLVQDEIAAMISNKLKAGFQQIIGRKDTGSAVERPARPEGNEYFDKGRYYWNQMQPGYIDNAILHFRKAIETDVNFFLAWPALAKAFAYKGFYNMMLPADAASRSLECLEEAGKLNPDHAHTDVGWGLYHLFFSWDWQAAATHLKKAIAGHDQENFILFNPVLHAAGVYHIASRHFEQAVILLRRALKMDPLNLSIQQDLARVYLYSRDLTKSLEIIDQLIRARPDFLAAFELRGWVLYALGRQRESIEAFKFFRKQSTSPVAGLSGLSYAYARTMQTKLAKEVKELLVSVAQDIPSYSPHYDLAYAHLGAQEYPAMFEQLHRAVEARIPAMIFLDADPVWEEIKRFKEFRALTNKLFGTAQRPPL